MHIDPVTSVTSASPTVRPLTSTRIIRTGLQCPMCRTSELINERNKTLTPNGGLETLYSHQCHCCGFQQWLSDAYPIVKIISDTPQ